MSEQNKPAVIGPQTDLSTKDLQKVEEFVQSGMPGLVALSDAELFKAADLYLNGKDYRAISNIINVPMPVILFLAKRGGWYERKLEMQEELASNLQRRIAESKLEDQDQLLDIKFFFRKKFRAKIAKYLKSGDDDISLDVKELAQYYRAVQMIDEMDVDARVKAAKPSPIGLNVGDGVTIVKNGDSLDITPKQKAVGDMLKELADMRRATEDKVEIRSDITNKEIKTSEGEGK